ncbi:MAG: hypothetical protein Q9219_001857 [cf. Caloplaca sp. 3 TL-2023]
MSSPSQENHDSTVVTDIAEPQIEVVTASEIWSQIVYPLTPPQDVLNDQEPAQETARDETGTPRAVESAVTIQKDSERYEALSSWSSPILEAAREDTIRFATDSKDLEFLSLFLSTERKVNIESPKRQALIEFLMDSLEKGYWRFAQKTIPTELEALQIFSADELEPHVWGAFLSINILQESGQLGDFGGQSIANIRHTAVHRYAYSTSLVKAAAIEASKITDDPFLKQLDLIMKVLYAETATDERFPVTEQQKETVRDLLWPADRPIDSTHQLLDKIQNIGEKSSHEFCRVHFPKDLALREVIAAEQQELTIWRNILTANCATSNDQANSPMSRISEKLQDTCVRGLRNAAAHRKMIRAEYLEEDLPRLTRPVARYVRILGDENAAAAIEQLALQYTTLALARYKEWMDPSRCQKTDLRAIHFRIEHGINEWAQCKPAFVEIGADIEHIGCLYVRSRDRFWHIVRENGWEEVINPVPQIVAADNAKQEPRPDNFVEEQDDEWVNGTAPVISEDATETCDNWREPYLNGGNNERVAVQW